MRNGLLVVFTGDGKGKTTAALGMAVRAAGHGMKVLVLQFAKGAWPYGETSALAKFPEIEIKPLGAAPTWTHELLDEERELVRMGWEQAADEIQKSNYDMIVLDELAYALHNAFLPLEPVLEVLRGRRRDLHLVITGRDAPFELIDIADLVTEMRTIKHSGRKAQEGIEF